MTTIGRIRKQCLAAFRLWHQWVGYFAVSALSMPLFDWLPRCRVVWVRASGLPTMHQRSSGLQNAMVCFISIFFYFNICTIVLSIYTDGLKGMTSVVANSRSMRPKKIRNYFRMGDAVHFPRCIAKCIVPPVACFTGETLWRTLGERIFALLFIFAIFHF